VRHLDLFTGIGGFSLAARANGIETVVMCEADPFVRAGLKRAWPGVPIIEDVRDFNGTKWTGAFILTAGVPCQPASRAGKQRGEEDDRWLWPEALRVVAEAKPRWCLFENPPGILDVGLDGILADLEALGYEPGICDVPACAVNSPQLRHRLWIVAHAKEDDDFRNPGSLQRQDEPTSCERQEGRFPEPRSADGGGDLAYASEAQRRARTEISGVHGTLPEDGAITDYLDRPGQNYLAHPHQTGRQGTDPEPGEDGLCAKHCDGDVADREKPREFKLGGGNESKERNRLDTEIRLPQQHRGSPSNGHLAHGLQGRPNNTEREIETEPDRYEPHGGIHFGGMWDSYLWTPCADGKVRRTPDDSFGLVDGLPRKILAALGNSIVWPVAAEIMRAIKESEDL